VPQVSRVPQVSPPLRGVFPIPNLYRLSLPTDRPSPNNPTSPDTPPTEALDSEYPDRTANS